MTGLIPASALAVDRTHLAAPPASLVRFVRSLQMGDEPDDERRASKRFNLSIEVPAVPLDKSLRVCGKPFLGISRNVSAGGMALVYTRPVPAAFLLVTLNSPEGEEVQLLLHVMRCRRLKHFFEIGGRFVAREGEETRPRPQTPAMGPPSSGDPS
jgi:hypothetical protein